MRLSSVIVFITFALSASTFPIADYSRTWRNSVQKRGPSPEPEHTPMEPKKLQHLLGVDNLSPEAFEYMLDSKRPMLISLFGDGVKHQAIITFRSSPDGPLLDNVKLVYSPQTWMIHYQSGPNGPQIDRVDSLDSKGVVAKTVKGPSGLELIPPKPFDPSRAQATSIIKSSGGEVTAVTFRLGLHGPELLMMTTVYPDGRTQKKEYQPTTPH